MMECAIILDRIHLGQLTPVEIDKIKKVEQEIITELNKLRKIRKYKLNELMLFLSVSCIWIPFPSSLLSTVECGGCTTLGFLGSPIKFNSPTEVVGTSPEGCDLHETSTERGCAPVPTSLLVVFNITQRGPSIPCTDPELSTTLVDGPTVVPLLLRHSPSVMADPPPTARPHPVASPRHRRYLGHIHRRPDFCSGRMGAGAGPQRVHF